MTRQVWQDDEEAIERLKKFILADGAKRMPAATSGHPCDGIMLYVMELEAALAKTEVIR